MATTAAALVAMLSSLNRISSKLSDDGGSNANRFGPATDEKNIPFADRAAGALCVKRPRSGGGAKERQWERWRMP
jgi:hypothetical protein